MRRAGNRYLDELSASPALQWRGVLARAQPYPLLNLRARLVVLGLMSVYASQGLYDIPARKSG
ncbi:MAG: hypothetical protein ACT4PZ_02865 [Panacagrimonas sp.]